jgi:hypothetical protein
MFSPNAWEMSMTTSHLTRDVVVQVQFPNNHARMVLCIEYSPAVQGVPFRFPTETHRSGKLYAEYVGGLDLAP